MNDSLFQAASAATLHRLNLERPRDLLHGVSHAPNSEARFIREAVVTDRGGGDKRGNLGGVEVHSVSGKARQMSLSHRSFDAQRTSTRKAGVAALELYHVAPRPPYWTLEPCLDFLGSDPNSWAGGRLARPDGSSFISTPQPCHRTISPVTTRTCSRGCVRAFGLAHSRRSFCGSRSSLPLGPRLREKTDSMTVKPRRRVRRKGQPSR